ncbi:MAG: hypothetical protein GC147_07375 [Porphyrobacter sp.]|nr:hypothetical protein [Porphyrobacter sp.]
MIGDGSLRMMAALALAAGGTVPALAQERAQGSQVETVQIGQQDAARQSAKAYLATPAPAPAAQPDPVASEQLTRSDAGRETAQLTATGEGRPAVAQLSPAELEATLSQLSPNERRVLLEAIEGSDICDHPPAVAAILTLCRNRIETRSGEFAPRAPEALSAEERLLRGGIDEGGTPNVERVIGRLARSSAAPNDLDNQAIASIALAPQSVPEDQGDPLAKLPNGTEAVINAIINQLTGGAGGP